MFKRNKIKPSLPKEILQEYYEQYGKDKVFCRAPFNNLYFLPDGKISACCINRINFDFGRYPQNTIKEIISSPNRKKQQKHVKNNNLSFGCNVCQKQMMSKNFSNVLATAYRGLKIKKQEITHIDFELSSNCNLKCIMCQLGKANSKSLYDEDFLNEIKPYLRKVKLTNFIGGELFTIDIYYKIWDYLLKKNSNCKINIQTNGTILNDKNIELIKSPNVSIVMSIDSINSTTYESIRLGAKFENLISNFYIINKIMQDKGLNMQISACPITLNAHEIPELVNFAIENNCNIFFNYTTNPPYLSLKYLSSLKIKELINFYQSHLNSIPQNNDVSKNNILALKGLINLLQTWYKEKYEAEKNTQLIFKNDINVFFEKNNCKAHYSIIEQFKNLLPDSWRISSNLRNKIVENKLNEEIAFLNYYQNDKNDLLKILITFFEVPKNE